MESDLGCPGFYGSGGLLGLLQPPYRPHGHSGQPPGHRRSPLGICGDWARPYCNGVGDINHREVIWQCLVSVLPWPWGSRHVGRGRVPWAMSGGTHRPQWKPKSPGKSQHAPWGLGRPLGRCRGAGDGQTAPCEFRLSPGCAVGLKIQVTPSRGMELTAACFHSFGNPRGRPWPPKASGVMCRPPGVLGWRLVWPWCALVAYRPWSGQGAAVVARAGRRLFGAVLVPLG